MQLVRVAFFERFLLACSNLAMSDFSDIVIHVIISFQFHVNSPVHLRVQSINQEINLSGNSTRHLFEICTYLRSMKSRMEV